MNSSVPPPAEFLPTRKSLLTRLKNLQDQESWRTFFDTYWKLIYSVAVKAGLNASAAQDVVQETVLAVTRSIGKFKYDPDKCAFKTWLLKVTRSRISNHFRSERKHATAAPRDTPDDPSWIENMADPMGNRLDALWNEEWEKNIMDAAITRVKHRIPAEQFQVFQLYVMKALPVMTVSRTFGVNAGQIYLIKHRISKLLKAEIRKLEDGGW